LELAAGRIYPEHGNIVGILAFSEVFSSLVMRQVFRLTLNANER